jgi:hypothetical protein
MVVRRRRRRGKHRRPGRRSRVGQAGPRRKRPEQWRPCARWRSEWVSFPRAAWSWTSALSRNEARCTSDEGTCRHTRSGLGPGDLWFEYLHQYPFRNTETALRPQENRRPNSVVSEIERAITSRNQPPLTLRVDNRWSRLAGSVRLWAWRNMPAQGSGRCSSKRDIFRSV